MNQIAKLLLSRKGVAFSSLVNMGVCASLFFRGLDQGNFAMCVLFGVLAGAWAKWFTEDWRKVNDES